jgi:hypothetical protein
MLNVSPDGRPFAIEVAPEARFSRITSAFPGAVYAMYLVSHAHGVPCVLTGAGVEGVYKNEPLHLRGYAWDFRSSNFPDRAKAFLELQKMLSIIDPRYRAVHIKAPHPDHFHVEWKGPTD